MVSLIAARCNYTNGIGINDKLPWKISEDLSYFKNLTSETVDKTKKNVVIMGRKTYFSIPKKFRPLENRINIVLSRNIQNSKENSEFISVANSLEEVNEIIGSKQSEIENIFVIGGESVYNLFLDKCDCIYLTNVYNSDSDFDTFFPEFDNFVKVESSERKIQGNLEYEFVKYKKIPLVTSYINLEENQYTTIIKELLINGNSKGDRTGTGVLSLFGKSMRFDLSNNKIPLLTTKRVFWRGVAEELLWFISGDTNAKTLQEKGIHIWDGNGSREYLDKVGLTDREEGDLGAIYGFQWRHFGAKYKTMHDNYEGQGIDQIMQLINTIKTNPNDRRMILSAWNPAAMDLMALPPCHMMAQFYVADGKLSCQMYQRSADMGLGVPFNIASYALLTHILAKCTDLEAGEFIHIMGDCHIYNNHIDPLLEQLGREPKEFPTLKINTENKEIDKFVFSDFEIVNYKPYKTIKMDMSV
jgi:dihydrofolate reductase/thymidylate synthase